VHDARLVSNLPQLARIRDWLRTCVQIAQTARCEPHSGLLSSLKNAECRDPQRRKECEPPPAGRAETKEDAREHQRRGQGNDAQPQALLLAAWTDVRNVGDGASYRSSLQPWSVARPDSSGHLDHDTVAFQARRDPAPGVRV